MNSIIISSKWDDGTSSESAADVFALLTWKFEVLFFAIPKPIKPQTSCGKSLSWRITDDGYAGHDVSEEEVCGDVLCVQRYFCLYVSP